MLNFLFYGLRGKLSNCITIKIKPYFIPMMCAWRCLVLNCFMGNLAKFKKCRKNGQGDILLVMFTPNLSRKMYLFDAARSFSLSKLLVGC